MSQRATSMGGKDLYKLLQVEHGSSLKEIKASYKRLALQLHPDRTKGDERKTRQFKQISEAYTILSNDQQRRQYDLQHGFRYNKNRRKPPPKNYRKVYAPVPPPHVKRTFDHVKHYEMHYGRGMMDEAIKNLEREAKRNGEPMGYQSPLGKGFSMSGGINETFNPYARSSRTTQGQATSTSSGGTTWMYEEGTMFEGSDDARGTIRRRAEIIQDAQGRRQVRKQKEAAAQEKMSQNANSAFAPSDENNCIIS